MCLLARGKMRLARLIHHVHPQLEHETPAPTVPPSGARPPRGPPCDVGPAVPRADVLPRLPQVLHPSPGASSVRCEQLRVSRWGSRHQCVWRAWRCEGRRRRRRRRGAAHTLSCAFVVLALRSRALPWQRTCLAPTSMTYNYLAFHCLALNLDWWTLAWLDPPFRIHLWISRDG